MRAMQSTWKSKTSSGQRQQEILGSFQPLRLREDKIARIRPRALLGGSAASASSGRAPIDQRHKWEQYAGMRSQALRGRCANSGPAWEGRGGTFGRLQARALFRSSWAGLPAAPQFIHSTFVQPVVDASESRAARANLTVRASPLRLSEDDHPLRASQVVVKLPRLTLEEQVALGVADERRTCDGLGNPVPYVEGQRSREKAPRGRCAGGGHPVREGLARRRRRPRERVERRAHLGRVVGSWARTADLATRSTWR